MRKELQGQQSQRALSIDAQTVQKWSRTTTVVTVEPTAPPLVLTVRCSVTWITGLHVSQVHCPELLFESLRLWAWG